MGFRILSSEPVKASTVSTVEELLDAKGQVVVEGKATLEAGTRKGSFVIEGKADLDDVANRVHSLRLPGATPILVIRAIPIKGATPKLDLIFSVIS